MEDYVEEALQMEFGDLDQTFYGLSPTITEALEKHLNANVDAFIQFES